jgi:hypothetical protein
MRDSKVHPLDVFLPYVKAIVTAHPDLAFIVSVPPIHSDFIGSFHLTRDLQEAMNPTVAGDDDTPADELEKDDDMTPIENLVKTSNVAFISNGGYDDKTGPEYAESTGNLVSYSRWFTCE